MSSDVMISVRGLGKAYVIDHDQNDHDTFAEAALWRLRHPFRKKEREVFWALRDLDFDIPPGDVVGLIGRNGAGKSTLLKILSRITGPTEGRAVLNGRVGCLLEVGTGFHRELTGRENIYLNGGILGMSRAEINRSFDEIVSFAGTERFLDTPVKRYSSGMYVRLAFSVAAHLNPEILLVDEVLSVGDAEFRKKCLSKMQDVARSGRTVVLVSHNAGTIERLCERCIWLDDGRLRAFGPASSVLGEYLEGLVEAEPEVDLSGHPERYSNAVPIFRTLRFLDGRGRATAAFPQGATIRLRLLVDPPEELSHPILGIGLDTPRGQRVLTAHTRFSRSSVDAISGPTWIECTMPDVPLAPGGYVVDLTVGMVNRNLDQIERAASIEILPRDSFGTGNIPQEGQGLIYQASDWRVVEESSPVPAGD